MDFDIADWQLSFFGEDMYYGHPNIIAVLTIIIVSSLLFVAALIVYGLFVWLRRRRDDKREHRKDLARAKEMRPVLRPIVEANLSSTPLPDPEPDEIFVGDDVCLSMYPSQMAAFEAAVIESQRKLKVRKVGDQWALLISGGSDG